MGLEYPSFNEGISMPLTQPTTTDMPEHVLRHQIHQYIRYDNEKTPVQVARKFKIPKRTAFISLNRAPFLVYHEDFKPDWAQSDCLFHLDEPSISAKEHIKPMSQLEPEHYDTVNQGCHYQWSEKDIIVLLCKMVLNKLETLTRTTKKESFKETIAFLNSPLIHLFARTVGIPHQHIMQDAYSSWGKNEKENHD